MHVPSIIQETHFLIPDLRRRWIVELNCRADLSRSERGLSLSLSVSVSISIEETDVDAEVGLLSLSSVVPPFWRCREVCGETDRDRAPLAWSTCPVPVCPSRFLIPSPSKCAWNVVVCCSRLMKLSCSWSNCRERRVVTRGSYLNLWTMSESALPAPCWPEATALATLTHCRRSHCCLVLRYAMLTPVGRGRVDLWGKTAEHCTSSLFLHEGNFTCSNCVLSSWRAWQDWSLFL